MCGINGLFAYHYAANPIDPRELVRTRDHMAARGPDGEGSWIAGDRRAAFGHRRLSIIDLSTAASQPMASEDGRTVVVFNGEIYNYEQLRTDLLAQGHTFRSHSDTEVLLHLYALKGADMVRDLRGMFAFAIWDENRRTMFLARDPYGIKPLYYADDGWTFRFASQVQALLAGGAVSRDADPAGRVGFALFGSVPEPFTMRREIRALPAGCTLTVDRVGAHEPRRYHSIAQVYSDAENEASGRDARANARAGEEFREALLDSVRHHLVADVPVGAFLSSGVDSSALVGLMRDAGQQEIQTVTLSFAEFSGRLEDEGPLAAEVAKQYGAKHTIRVVTESEFADDLPRILGAMDQPSIDGVNTWFVAKAARELGLKVAISGIGGDELFGGYASFRDIPRWVGQFRVPARAPFLGRLARMAGSPIAAAAGVSPKAAGMLEYGGSYAGAYLLKRGLFMPWELPGMLPRDVVVEGMRRLEPLNLIEREITPTPATASARVSALESGLYLKNQLLRDTDWAAMAHSLEVRTPLVDANLLSKAAAIVGSSGVAPRKEFLADAPSRPLPAGIKGRAKTGFMTPVAAWRRQWSSVVTGGIAPQAPAGVHWSRAWSQIVFDAEEERWRAA